MTAETSREQSGDMPFTVDHAAELNALLEEEQLRVPSLKEKHLPGYEGAPLSLEPIESDEQFRAIWAKFEPLYAQARDTANQEQKALLDRVFSEEVTPMLRERMEMLAELPMVWGNMMDQEALLGLSPAVPDADKIDYGLCDVDVERIVATPSHDNWAGIGSSKNGAKSSDLIIGHALNMLNGNYRFDAASQPSVQAAIDNDKNYVYLTEDGSHRIGAAKLLGRKTLPAEVKSYNYTAHDDRAKGVDAEQRTRLP